MSTKKTNRCWPGYEPVPGKEPHSQGSCRPKADSKSTPSEKAFKTKRKRQLDDWQATHKGKRRQAARHLSGPDNEPSSQKGAAKKSAPTKAVKKPAAKKSAPRKNAAKKRASAKRTNRTKAA